MTYSSQFHSRKLNPYDPNFFSPPLVSINNKGHLNLVCYNQIYALYKQYEVSVTIPNQISNMSSPSTLKCMISILYEHFTFLYDVM